MFTGIIEGLGRISSIRHAGRGVSLAIESGFPLEDPEIGESIAVNGVCLTATSISLGAFTAEVSPESLSRTTLGNLKRGDKVNLERALRLSDRLGGHLVSGHVDAVGRILERKALGDFTLFTFSVPPELSRYLIEKGSVAVDGISLTVNSCDKGSFSVSVIPHSAQITTMGFKTTGDKVNIEVDLVGKYIEKLIGAKEKGEKGREGLDTGLLARYGFI